VESKVWTVGPQLFVLGVGWVLPLKTFGCLGIFCDKYGSGLQFATAFSSLLYDGKFRPTLLSRCKYTGLYHVMKFFC